MKIELLAGLGLGAAAMGSAVMQYAQAVPVMTIWSLIESGLFVAAVGWGVSAEVRLQKKANNDELREVKGNVTEMRSDYARDAPKFLSVAESIPGLLRHLEEANAQSLSTAQGQEELAKRVDTLTAAIIESSGKREH